MWRAIRHLFDFLPEATLHCHSSFMLEALCDFRTYRHLPKTHGNQVNFTTLFAYTSKSGSSGTSILHQSRSDADHGKSSSSLPKTFCMSAVECFTPSTPHFYPSSVASNRGACSSMRPTAPRSPHLHHKHLLDDSHLQRSEE